MKNRENLSKLIEGIDENYVLEAEERRSDEEIVTKIDSKRKNVLDEDECESGIHSGLWRVLIAFASAAAVFLVVYFGIVKKADNKVTVNTHAYLTEDEAYHEKVTDDNAVLREMLAVAEMLEEKEMKDTLRNDERYGGYYVSGDKIIICVTDTSFRPVDSEYVKYKKVEHSYRTLVYDMKSVGDGIRDWADAKKNSSVYKLCKDGFATVGIDYEYNTVVVAFGNLDDAKREYFDSLFPNLDYFILIDTEKSGENGLPSNYPYTQLQKLAD